MKHAHPKSENTWLTEALAQLQQAAPSKALDTSVLATIQQKMAREQEAQHFEYAIKNPQTVDPQSLPETVKESVAIYHLLAKHISEDKTLTANDVTARQAALLTFMTEAIGNGKPLPLPLQSSTVIVSADNTNDQPSNQAPADIGLQA
jgi:hypothetical protein